MARAIILAGLIGVTIGLGALTWLTFSILFVLIFLCAVPVRRKRPVCVHHIQHSHCRVLQDGGHDQ